MAEEKDDSQKTEAPSQKKLDEARERGQLVASREVATLLFFGAAALLCMVLAPASAARIAATGRALLAQAHLLRVDQDSLASLCLALLGDLGLALAVPLLALLAVPVVSAALQNAVVWTAEPLTPKFERVSPLAGIKRLVSLRTLVEFVKNGVKIAVVGGALGVLLWPERQAMVATAGLEAGPLLDYLLDVLFRLLVTLAVLAAFVAVGDYGYQWFDFMKQMRMSREELRDEHKQNEGDPHVRQRQRAIRLERSRRRMMADVPKATVVVMNPTHFAVALRYVAGETPAPKVLAKGTDAVALRIRAVAEANRIPVVENPPLARALFAACDLGELVPPAHYQAVAEVISYVLQLGERQQQQRG